MKPDTGKSCMRSDSAEDERVEIVGALAFPSGPRKISPEEYSALELYYGGGGGYDGVITPLSMPALTGGYAQVVSDAGHQDETGMSAAFAFTDTFAAQLFGSISVPTVMSTALTIVTAAYGAPPTKSYFEGCSNGGREALMAVQRNPNLFDGVIARAPGYNWVGFMGAPSVPI